MKKRFYIILLFAFMAFCSRVNAYTCGYYGENGSWRFHVDYTVESGNITFRDDSKIFYINKDFYLTKIMDFAVSEKYKGKTNKEQLKMLVDYLGKDRCPRIIYLCEGTSKKNSLPDMNGATTISEDYAILFEMQYQTQAGEYKGPAYDYNFGNDLNKSDEYNTINFSGNNNCFEISIYDQSVKDAEVVDFIGDECDFLSKYIDGEGEEINSLKSYYDNCKKSSEKDCVKYNENKNIIKSFCYSTIEHTNYYNPCLKKCSTEVPDLIGKIESSFDGKVCHLSDKIIKFIANILKWVKYFAPALVIILCLLDFIKALAAQNDEDMKKAQSRFVKRLIAAALLFIIPFLIEFTLDKFNLVKKDPFCGLF